MPELVKAVEGIFPKERLAELRHDCGIIFTAKAVSKDEDYSSGSTFFVKANDVPRTGLEELAQKIFFFHAQGLEYDPKTSGAEWWSQVIHPEDDIGVHWDRDYGLEEEEGRHVYPYVGTVTYLSDVGAPTVVFDKPGTSKADEEIVGSIRKMVVSCPSVSSHIAFDGTMLHAAPSDILNEDSESGEEDGDSEDGSDDDESSAAPSFSELLATIHEKRITFLVNVWINHVPSQSKRCGKKVIKQLKTPLLGEEIQFDGAESKHHTIALKDKQLSRAVDLTFNNTDTNYGISIPLPDGKKMKALQKDHRVFLMSYKHSKTIDLAYSLEQPSSSDDDEDSEDNSEDEELEDDEEKREQEAQTTRDKTNDQHQNKKKRNSEMPQTENKTKKLKK